MAKLEKPSAIDYLDEVTHGTNTHTVTHTHIHTETHTLTYTHRSFFSST